MTPTTEEVERMAAALETRPGRKIPVEIMAGDMGASTIIMLGQGDHPDAGQIAARATRQMNGAAVVIRALAAERDALKADLEAMAAICQGMRKTNAAYLERANEQFHRANKLEKERDEARAEHAFALSLNDAAHKAGMLAAADELKHHLTDDHDVALANLWIERIEAKADAIRAAGGDKA